MISSTLSDKELEQARLTPASVFSDPSELLAADIPTDQKIKILKQWELDEREIAVADEENMVGDGKSKLGAVKRALIDLGVPSGE